ncbi:hypothetical protein BDW59DRAFT_177021 [Aspergillus cavernicola]|uniref:Uncharacterized protein n=1 Tax=Aspergillus cavernicola TaxID=176166 RepID=A0ABR4H9U4_9EURO
MLAGTPHEEPGASHLIIFQCDDGRELREAAVCPAEGHWERFNVREQNFFNLEEIVPRVKRRDYLPCDTIRILFAHPSRKELKNQPLHASLKKTLTSLNKKVKISGLPYDPVFFLSLESSIDEIVESNQPYDRPNLIFYEYFSGWYSAKMADLVKGIEGYTSCGSILEGLFGNFGVEAPYWHAVVCCREERLKNRKGFVELLCGQMTQGLDLSDAFRFMRPSLPFMMIVSLRRAREKIGSYLKMALNLN